MSTMDVDQPDTSKPKDGKKPRFEVKKVMFYSHLLGGASYLNGGYIGISSGTRSLFGLGVCIVCS